MTFEEYQEGVLSTCVYPNVGSNIYYPTLGLAGEAGEICNKVKKIMRDADGELSEKVQTELIDELGDCMWYIAAIAHELDVNISTIAELNNMKLADRKRRGVIKGSGDTR
jgi:NTP pyrophosphatase (non-canonical NTP hydrolase)